MDRGIGHNPIGETERAFPFGGGVRRIALLEQKPRQLKMRVARSGGKLHGLPQPSLAFFETAQEQKQPCTREQRVGV